MTKNKSTIQERLEQHSKSQDIIGRYYNSLQAKTKLSTKHKMAEIHTSEAVLVLAKDDHFIYIDDHAIMSSSNDAEMFKNYSMLFNLFYILYGEDFKIEDCFME